MGQLTPEEMSAWPKAQQDGVSFEEFTRVMLAKRTGNVNSSAPAMTAAPGQGQDINPDFAGPSFGPGNLRAGATIPQAVDEEARAKDPDYIKLQDGRWAYVGTGTGRLIPKARQIMNEDGENFSDCLAALVTRIDGKPITIEDLYDLPLRDASQIIGRHNIKNG